MAKKQDPSMNLSYILKKQEEEKLSGLSANVASQLTEAGVNPTATPKEATRQSTKEKPTPQLNITPVLTELKSLNNNMLKVVKSMAENNGLLKTLVKNSKEAKSSKNNLTEDKLEDQNFKDKLMDLIIGIKAGTDKIEKPKKGFFDDLGKWAAGLALALGALIGWIQAKVKFLSRFIPDNLLESVKKRFANIGKFFEELIAPLKERFGKAFGKIAAFFEQTFSKIKKLLSFDKEASIFAELGKAFKAFISPFKNAFRILRVLVSGPIKEVEGIFSGIAKFVKTFSGVIGKVASIIKIIGEPILIIMAIYDTVKGAIEGFKKEGIVGAVKGALKGLFDATIGGFLDLIKDIGSWVLEKIGFKSAAKFLDSFSFKDLYSKFLDLMFAPAKWFQDMLLSLWNTVKSIQIGPFSIFGKKLGPWKPFASLGGSDTSTPSDNTSASPTSSESSDNTSATPTPTPATSVSPAPNSVQSSDLAPSSRQTADTVYTRSGENAGIAQASPASAPVSVVNAPTTITKQTSNNLIKLPVRDEDTTIQQYYRSRFAY